MSSSASCVEPAINLGSYSDPLRTHLAYNAVTLPAGTGLSESSVSPALTCHRYVTASVTLTLYRITVDSSSARAGKYFGK
jgi:hypothetical protein